MLGSVLPMPLNFNSHAHVERDANPVERGTNLFDFNSHAHVERDRHIINPFTRLVISTHTLTWSVTIVRVCIAYAVKFQLTRSRGA